MGLRDWMGVHEKAAVFILVALLLVANLAVLGFVYSFSGSHYQGIYISYVDTPAGMEVSERLDVSVSPTDDFRVLYRSFDDTICTSGCSQRIVSVECSAGNPYMNSISTGVLDMRTKQPASLDYDVRNRIESNEVGCYSAGYSGKEETITIRYIVDGSIPNDRHALFTKDHFAIDEIKVHGTQSASTHGYVPANAWVSIDTRTGDVSTGDSLYVLLVVMALITISPLVIYYLFGKDRDDMVPQYLHVVPNPQREGWEVDVLMNGSAQLTKNGMGSLLLSMYMKGAANVEDASTLMTKKLRITVYKNPKKPLTATEKELLDILSDEKEQSAADYTVYTCKLSSKKEELQKFMRNERATKLTKGLYQHAGQTLIWVLAVGAFILGRYIVDNPALRIALQVDGLLLVLMMFIIPPAVFARFKGEYHKEYLSWISFKRMLTDFAQIQKYLKEDSQQWKDWLVYASALGASAEMLNAMKELKVISAAEYARIVSVNSSVNAVAASTASSGSSGGGGGGGFGGGGGGGR